MNLKSIRNTNVGEAIKYHQHYIRLSDKAVDPVNKNRYLELSKSFLEIYKIEEQRIKKGWVA